MAYIPQQEDTGTVTLGSAPGLRRGRSRRVAATPRRGPTPPARPCPARPQRGAGEAPHAHVGGRGANSRRGRGAARAAGAGPAAEEAGAGLPGPGCQRPRASVPRLGRGSGRGLGRPSRRGPGRGGAAAPPRGGTPTRSPGDPRSTDSGRRCRRCQPACLCFPVLCPGLLD